MAYVTKLPSGKWRATARYKGERYTKTSPLKKVVEEWAKGIELNGPPTEPELGPGEIAFSQWYETWRSTRQVEDSTERTEKALSKKHLEPFWNERRLIDIRPSTVKEWFAWMEDQESGRETQRKMFNVLRVCLDAAVVDELIATNPCASVKAPSAAPSKVDWYTQEQVWAIVKEMPSDVDKALVLLMSFCGLRWGEAAGLQVQGVDVGRRRVMVRQVATQVGELKAYPKSSSSQREVPIPPSVIGYLLPLLENKGRMELVCPASSGEPQIGTNWRKRWYKAVEKARVIVQDGAVRRELELPQYSPHALRHSGASWLVQAGVPLREVQAFLGNSSPVMTNRYAHLAPDSHAAVEAAWKTMEMGPIGFAPTLSVVPDEEARDSS